MRRPLIGRVSELDQRNIFYVHGSDKASLDRAYLHITRRIGPEYLMKEF